MKHKGVQYFVLVVYVVFALLGAYAFYYLSQNQPVFSLPSLKVKEGSEMHAFMNKVGANEITYVFEKGKITFSINGVRCCKMIYTAEEMGNLIETVGNIAFGLNGDYYQSDLLANIERDPFIRDNLNLVGKFIYNFPIGFRLTFYT